MFQSSSREFTDNHHKPLEFKSLSKCSARNLLGEVDYLRIAASLKQDQKQKGKLGQFLTSAPVAELMAGMFGKLDLPQISLLDAGAGVGSLLAAFVANLCHSQKRPANLDIVAYEIDPFLIGYLHQTLKLCARECQNILIEKIINEFAERFTPGGKLIYVGDTDEKFAHFNKVALKNLGVTIDSHGKMPDVIIHYLKNDWLVLIEAVTSHGPINPKRKIELEVIFADIKIPLVMVTSFLSRKAMVEYLAEIAWESDVWVAEDSTHLIHFNGEYLLQAYKMDRDSGRCII